MQQRNYSSPFSPFLTNDNLAYIDKFVSGSVGFHVDSLVGNDPTSKYCLGHGSFTYSLVFFTMSKGNFMFGRDATETLKKNVVRI